MIKSALSKVVWMARATTVVVGVTIMLGLIFGVATSAFGANGGNFILGSLNNTATAITKLTGTVGGGPAVQVSNPSTATGSTALDLQVATGKAPMKVNRTTKVANLNADKVDGLDASQLGGLSGVEQVEVQGALNSDDIKVTSATCPEGKVAIGGGARMNGFIDVAALHESRQEFSSARTWVVGAHEHGPTEKEWELDAFAICASARP